MDISVSGMLTSGPLHLLFPLCQEYFPRVHTTSPSSSHPRSLLRCHISMACGPKIGL